MASQQYYYYKIILIGDAGVGKTTLFNRIKTGKFIELTQVTVGTQRVDEYLYRTVIGDDSLNVSCCIMYMKRMTGVATWPLK